VAESAVTVNKYARWRARVEELLRGQWDRARLDLREIAATVVGMFDAGADSSEVAAFLRDRERLESGAPWLTDDARLELVDQLQSSAGQLEPRQSADDDSEE
jgi:hypothetical protein